MIWKHYADVSGSASDFSPLPTVYNELCLMMMCNDETAMYIVPAVYLSSENRLHIINGGYAHEEAGSRYYVYISATHIKIAQVYQEKKDVTNSCVVRVAYR